MNKNLRLAVIYTLCTVFSVFSLFFGYGQVYDDVTAMNILLSSGIAVNCYMEYRKDSNV